MVCQLWIYFFTSVVLDCGWKRWTITTSSSCTAGYHLWEISLTGGTWLYIHYVTITDSAVNTLLVATMSWGVPTPCAKASGNLLSTITVDRNQDLWWFDVVGAALKYTTTFPVIFLSALKYHVQSTFWYSTLRPVWVLFAIINSGYSYWWDITKDWDLGFETDPLWLIYSTLVLCCSLCCVLRTSCSKQCSVFGKLILWKTVRLNLLCNFRSVCLVLITYVILSLFGI